jgi:asparagine synthase (glutamine-hydrolysing)
MCGLAGFYSPQGCGSAAGRHILGRMGQAIVHRGPDQGAVWIDPGAGIGLSSRRLAIIELSPAGNQPMVSHSGRFALSYNGEIYNHRDLRRELEESHKAPNWRGSSDTESLLAGFEEWGVVATLQRAVGMFALALWDRQERRLTLARDRLGEKPLYYGWQGQGRDRAFLFGSELKALACHPSFEGDIDREALAGYLRDAYVSAPFSIYRNIFKLLPGCVLTLGNVGEAQVEPSWSAANVIENGLADRSSFDEREAVDELDRLLAQAAAGQTVADVPVGAFLSGGLDSSTVVAFMQRASSIPVQTFTAGSADPRYDEAPFARDVARHLGTEHHEIVISGEDTLAVVPKLPFIYDEPFADSSQVPAFLISQLARTRVTVALTGDGGDELFAGYDKYPRTQRLWSHIRKVPRPLRSATGAVLGVVPAELWNGIGRLANLDRPHSTLSDQVRKGARLLAARSPTEIGRTFSDRWDGRDIVIGADARSEDRKDYPLEPAEAVMAMHLEQYLPDDLLVKVDRAAMAVSLETRAPFLDHRIVEFAWRLPLHFKLRGSSTKWILRQVLARYVPERLFDRPTRGFSVPVDEWLRGPLKDWAEEMLSVSRLRDQGFFQPDLIRRSWAAHLSGSSNRQAELWTVLMFQAWLDVQSLRPAQKVARAVA